MSNDSQHLKIVIFLFIALVIVALLPKAYASPSPINEQIDRIREIYSLSIELLRNKKAKRYNIFSETGKDGYDIKRWHLNNEKNTYIKGAHEVIVFIKDKSIVKIRHVIQSLSGDWAYVIDYFYYSNGNVAFIYEGNTTYNGYIIRNKKKISPVGPFVVEKRSYFSESGKRIRFLKKSFVRNTGTVVPNDQIQDIDPKKYKSISSLPYIKLIEKYLSVPSDRPKPSSSTGE